MSMIGMFAQLTPAQLSQIAEDESTLSDMLDDEDTPSLSVGKMWEGLEHLLDRYTDERGTSVEEAIRGGEAVGDDLGYGPAGVLQPDEVADLSQQLAALDLPLLRAVYDPQEMEDDDVYPSSIWVSEGEEALECLLECLGELRAFYADAASKGNGIATWLS